MTLETFDNEISKSINIEGISILQLNVRGINVLEKFKEIKKMLNNLKVKPGIIVFTETKLLKDKDYYIKNYQKFICCRNAEYPGGGVLAYIYKDFIAEESPTFTDSAEKLKIELSNHNITLICYYRRCKSYKFKSFMKDIEMEMQLCRNKRIIFVGDFNLDITNISLDDFGRKFLFLLSCYNFKIVNNAITRNEKGTIIDHLIINFKDDCYIRNYTIKNDISDHNIVLSIISEVSFSNFDMIGKNYINYDKMQESFENCVMKAMLGEQNDPVIIIEMILNIVVSSIYASSEKVKNEEEYKNFVAISKINGININANKFDCILENLIKSIEKGINPHINHLTELIQHEKIREIIKFLKSLKFSLIYKIVQRIICKILNLKFNKKLKQNYQNCEISYNEEIAACELWEYVLEKLDIQNNIISLISLDIKNNFEPENIEKLFFQDGSTNIINNKIQIKGRLFIYGNNYILLNNNVILDDLVKNIKSDMMIIHEFLSNMKMELKNEDSKFMFFGTTKKKIEYHEDLIIIKFDDKKCVKISKSDTIKYSDLIIEKNKNWKEHISNIVTQVTPFVKYLGKIKDSVDENYKKQFYTKYIESRLTKHISIWGFATKVGNCDYLEPLRWIQNMALRIVYNKNGMLCHDMFTNQSNQLEIYLNNTGKFLPIKGLFYVKTINLVRDMANGNIRSSIIRKLEENEKLEPKKFRTLTSNKCLRCLGVKLFNQNSHIQDLKSYLIGDEKMIKLFLNYNSFKSSMDKCVKNKK